jgi:hypothetical protein
MDKRMAAHGKFEPKEDNPRQVTSGIFTYVASLSRLKTYKEWKCKERLKKGWCAARFCGSLDGVWYWKHNPKHTCVVPPQDDLTPKEVADALLDSILPEYHQ